MTLFRTVNGVVEWFDNGGNPIHPDGSPRSGPTIDALGGPDGSFGDESFRPPAAAPIVVAPAPAPSTAPPLAAGFVNLNVRVHASSGAAIANAGVFIGRDYGNGRARTTDGNGFANFGVVGPEPALAWQVSAAGYGDAYGSVAIGYGDAELVVTLVASTPGLPAPSPAPAPTPSPVPAPAPPPTPHPPAPSPSPVFVNLNFIVTDAGGRAIYVASVYLDTDFGNGASRTTDGNGFANFGVWAGASIGWLVRADGYADAEGRVQVAAGGDTLTIALGAPGSVPPAPRVPPPNAPPVGELGELTPASAGLGGAPPAPGFQRATFETRAGVPSLTAESFSALDIAGFGPSPSGIFTTIVGALIGLFKGSSGGADVARLSNVVQNIGSLLLQTVSTLAELATRSVHTDTQGGNLFSHILGGVLGPIINALAAVIRGGSTNLGKLFGPISDALKKVLDKVRHLYDTWLKPILHVIDVTRQILRILAAFHLDFARDLDAQLGKLEGKLTAPYLKLVSEINKTRNVINRIVTLEGNLQRVTLLQSLTKHRTCVQRAIDQAPMAPAGTWPEKVAPLERSGTQSQLQTNLQLLAADEDGPWSAGYEAFVQLLSEDSAA